ncbi:MAG: alpha/beta hydrolase [Clostridia bacterium]|nr:alpha/beta hydrolase [Clostridia bacterium]
MKYPIDKELSPFCYFTPPIRNVKMAGALGSMMRAPRWIKRKDEIEVTSNRIKSYDGAEIEVLLFEPRGIVENSPCLVYYHGGGFFFGAAWYHYKIAKRYALEVGCKLAFVQYRLAPKNPHPTPSEDCYAALKWTFENSSRLGIDKNRIAVGGDSAGGALAAAVCQMARDRGIDMPCFQLLVYPVTDRRMDTESNRKFTDTPMWNSTLSAMMWQGYVQDEKLSNIAYASPMEANSFAGLPDAYVETAEFDCLRDEGVAYADALKAAGVDVVLNETKGTMHGFDAATGATVSKNAVARRIQYMKKMFER